MKKQKLYVSAVSILAACILTGLFSATAVQAQDEDDSMILSMTEFVIKPGHTTQFREGVKAWKECYVENEGDWTWDMWSRVQGEGTVFGLTSFMENWAEMDDASDEAGQACSNLAMNLINPSVESANRNLSTNMPSMSRTPGDNMGLVSVTYWRVSNSSQFLETVAEITSAISEAEGEPRGYWYDVVGGGLTAPHYFVVGPYVNFAAMDNDRDGVWTVVENELGANRRAELQSNYRESVDQVWSYMWRHVADLSYAGSE